MPCSRHAHPRPGPPPPPPGPAATISATLATFESPFSPFLEAHHPSARAPHTPPPTPHTDGFETQPLVPPCLDPTHQCSCRLFGSHCFPDRTDGCDRSGKGGPCFVGTVGDFDFADQPGPENEEYSFACLAPSGLYEKNGAKPVPVLPLSSFSTRFQTLGEEPPRSPKTIYQSSARDTARRNNARSRWP